MHDFELSLEYGNPINLVSFILDLVSTPPILAGKALNIEKYTPVNTLVKNIPFRDANTQEGFLNIYSCRFESGKCTVHIFGILKGLPLKSEIDFKVDNLRDFEMLNEKIKFILNKSKNILKSYYKDSKIRNIEHHILAFLSDSLEA